MKKIIYSVLILFIIFLDKSYSQWFQVGQTLRNEYITNISVPDSNVVWISWIDLNLFSKIIRTTNGGQNWNFVTPPLNGYYLTNSQGIDSVTALASVGFPNPVLWKTNDAGKNWNPIVGIPGNNGYFDDIVFSKSNPQFGFAVGNDDNLFYIFKTTDGGKIWNQSTFPLVGIGPDFLSGFAVDELFFGFNVWLNDNTRNAFITSDGGTVWNQRNSSTPNFGGLAFSDNKRDGIVTAKDYLPSYKKTTDGGVTWNVQTINSNVIGENYPVWISGTNTVFFNSKYEIFRSDDGGNSWTMQYQDNTDDVIHMDYARYGNTIVAYAICLNGRILKSRQSVITGIKNISTEIPSEYSLSQNYPNPFNPTTKIRFDITRDARRERRDVKLVIYDALGRQVETLVNKQLSPGSYEVEFYAGNLPSGTYFYKLWVSIPSGEAGSPREAGNFSTVKRMTLLK